MFSWDENFFRFICNCLNCNNHCNDHIVFLKFETIVLICSATGNQVRFFDYCYICIEFKALRLLWKHSISSCGIEASKVELLIKIYLLNLPDDVPDASCGKLENRHRPYKWSYRNSKRILKKKTAWFCISFFFLCAVLNRGWGFYTAKK